MRRHGLGRVFWGVIIPGIGIAVWMTVASESVQPGERAGRLRATSQAIDRSALAVSAATATSLTEQTAKETAQALTDLKQLVAANLAIREDAERAANWSLWTLRLIAGVSLITLGASCFGGYSLITSTKEQATILENARKTQEDARLAQEASQKTVDAVSADASAMKNLMNETEQRLATIASKVDATLASFDFSRLDAVIVDSLVGSGHELPLPESLPSEEKVRVEDYDIQTQMGKIIGSAIDAKTYYKLGRYYRYVGNHAKALVRFEDALQRDPKHLEAWLAKALSYATIARSEPSPERRRGLLEKAIEDVERGRPLALGDVDKFQFHFIEGWMLDEVERFGEAITAYEKAKGFKADPRLDYNIACSLSKARRFEESLNRLRQIGDPKIVRLATGDPDFEPLRNDPVYGAALLALIQGLAGRDEA